MTTISYNAGLFQGQSMEQYDLAIIGGGINGCGIAAEAALRGLSVIVFEQGDIAQSTSSASSKLIHGGLRYLEQYDFALVYKALKEREVLLDIASGLVKPLEFVIPHHPGLRSRWLIRLGLFLYDFLYPRNHLPKSSFISRAKNPAFFAPLQARYSHGFRYFDAHTDDARLTIANALLARDKGAVIANYEAVISCESQASSWLIETPKRHVHAKVLINATGPWMQEVNRALSLPNAIPLQLIKGSHIVVPKLYEGEQAYLMQHEDGRVVFVIPYHNMSLIGTTDVPFHGHLGNVEINAEEINYLLNLCSQFFARNLKPEDILFSWSGVRPLLGENSLHPQALSREYFIHRPESQNPCVMIYGGKITTYRKLACDTLDALADVFPKLAKSTSHLTPLPGAYPSDFQHRLMQQYPWLPEALATHYIEAYGALSRKLLGNARSLEDLGQHFGGLVYQAEIDYALQQEFARTAADILWRRTKLGYYVDRATQENIERYLAQISQDYPPLYS